MTENKLTIDEHNKVISIKIDGFDALCILYGRCTITKSKIQVFDDDNNLIGILRPQFYTETKVLK